MEPTANLDVPDADSPKEPQLQESCYSYEYFLGYWQSTETALDSMSC